MTNKLIWSTPDGDNLVGYMARVSNPKAQPEDDASKLVKYLIDHKHWSPLEMVDACVEINTTRDISHQLVRHRSFSFQEFSGRYSAYESLNTDRECRMQDTKNRQNSIEIDGLTNVSNEFDGIVHAASKALLSEYQYLLSLGVAKECARAILPEGLVPAKLYMKGSLRSWVHYWQVRCTPETQKEHRLVAESTRDLILPQFPLIREALLVH